MTDPELSDVTAPMPIGAGERRMGPADTEPTGPLVAGAVLAGRYRLLNMCGSDEHVQFWQGTDTATGQLVALSLVDVQGVLPVERVNEVLSLSIRLRGLDVRGVARILNVLLTHVRLVHIRHTATDKFVAGCSHVAMLRT
jgi:putative peptidoglycan lipid II flippase